MVTKRIRSEYMKRFKDPKWETYSRCYEEMLKYRLTRRLLEHTHNPWFWNGSDSDSDSGGRTPPPPSKNQVGPEPSRDGTQAELEECEGARRQRQNEQDQHCRTTEPVPRGPLQQDDQCEPGAQGPQLHDATETRAEREEREEQSANSRDSKRISAPHRDQDQEANAAGPRPRHSKASKSSKQAWRSQRVRPASSRQLREDDKGSRHPFALYGSGEKDADIAGRKTHNVRPEASTTEIHESALRAKTRREVERQIQTQKNERRRAKSADLEKARKLVQPEYNPWLTEYMRCFSARSR